MVNHSSGVYFHIFSSSIPSRVFSHVSQKQIQNNFIIIAWQVASPPVSWEMVEKYNNNTQYYVPKILTLIPAGWCLEMSQSNIIIYYSLYRIVFVLVKYYHKINHRHSYHMLCFNTCIKKNFITFVDQNKWMNHIILYVLNIIVMAGYRLRLGLSQLTVRDGDRQAWLYVSISKRILTVEELFRNNFQVILIW